MIPIVNNHNQIYYFADSRNNDHGEGERGYIKLNIAGQGYRKSA